MTQAVFIFTKDRPEVLKNTLLTLCVLEMPVFLIDDSRHMNNRVINRQFLGENQTYLGIEEYERFLVENGIDRDKYGFILKSPGQNHWNLGYMRNFAMLYARHYKFSRILFMDDDITIDNQDVITSILLELNHYKLVGAEITGLVDDSILGHIATAMNIHDVRTLSGGFMAFNPLVTTNYFLNNYNEDWIWIFLEASDKQVLMTGHVCQALSNPMQDWEEKIRFQEFGEIVLEGVLDVRQMPNREETLQDVLFWERIIKERIQYICALYESAAKVKNDAHLTILRSLIADFDFNPPVFSNLFIEYFSNKSMLKPLFESI